MIWKQPQWHIPPLFSENTEKSIAAWENGRREELLAKLAETIYGITPARKPDRTEIEVFEDVPTACGCKNHHKKVRYHLYFGAKSVALEIWTWVPYGEGPFPVQMMIDPFEKELHAKEPPEYLYGFFPADMITDRGYAAVKVLTSSVCPDDKKRYANGILSILTGEEEGIPQEYRWGAIGAWAWAGSRCVDYLETQPEFDAQKIAISGCSRAGKTALWCGAQDQRIAVVMSNVSGTGGAALERGKIGEHISDITTNYPFWFCKNYAAYAADEDAMPVDAHMLLAMAAPRPMYLASASVDVWADIQAEYAALRLASELYTLYTPGLILPERRPAANQPFHIGRIGYHIREGIHDLTFYDWICYMDFCDSYLK